MKRYLLLLLLALSGCGSAENGADFDPSVSTDAPPFIHRVNPNTGRAGDTITIFGFGFSNGAGSNVITIGGQGTSATTYTLLNPATDGEVESLTFTIPTGATTGTSAIFVTVFDNTSNANVNVTVNP